METRIADLLTLEKTARERGLRVVAIGGGTGLSTLLKGLKRFASPRQSWPRPLPAHPLFAIFAP